MKLSAFLLSLFFALNVQADWKQKLLTAIETENLDIIKRILDEGGDPNFSSGTGKGPFYSPLHLAAEKCNEALVDLLMAYKASPGTGAYSYDYKNFRFPLNDAADRACEESLLRKLTTKDVFDTHYSARFALKDTLLKRGKVSVDYLAYLSTFGDTTFKEGISIMFAINHDRKDWFEYFMSLGTSPQGILPYAVGQGQKTEYYVDELLNAGAEYNAIGFCHLEYNYYKGWVKGNPLECAVYTSGALPLWYMAKFPNQKFSVEVTWPSPMDGWNCLDYSYGNFKELITNEQVVVKNPQSLFNGIILKAIDHQGLMNCASEFPFLETLLQKYTKEINVDDSIRWGDNVYYPFSSLLQFYGENIYLPILLKYGAKLDDLTWSCAHNYIDKTKYLLSISGGKFPEKFLDKYLNGGSWIDEDYLPFLLKSGLKATDVSIIPNLSFRLARDWKKLGRFLDIILSHFPKTDLAKLSLKDLIERYNWDFAKDDGNYMDIGDKYIKAGVPAKTLIMSDYCYRSRVMGWAKSKGATNDGVGIECLYRVSTPDYFKLIDAGYGSLSEEKNCMTPLKKYVFGGQDPQRTEYLEGLKGFDKRGARLENPVCGRQIMDMYLENPPEYMNYYIQSFLTFKKWNLKSATYKQGLARALYGGLYAENAIPLIDRGANVNEGYKFGKDDDDITYPVAYVVNFQSNEFLDKMIAFKTNFEQTYSTRHGSYYRTNIALRLAGLAKDSQWSQFTLEKLYKGGQLKRYVYKIDEQEFNVLLETEKFPMNLMEFLKPTKEELTKIFGDETVLMRFSGKGQLDAVEKLVDFGSEVNQKNRYNWTALDFALSGGHTAVAKYLISKGAQSGRGDQ